MTIIQFLDANLTDIKDVLWIIFTIIATTISILTYRKAKKSMLQPLRTEVIKRQTDLLVELLEFLVNDGVHFNFKVDYMGIINCNAYLLLKEYGFVLKDDVTEKAVRDNIAGMLILKKEGQLNSLCLPSVFSHPENEEKPEYPNKEKYLLAKKGLVELEVLHLTKTHQKCIEKLNYFISNPFLPTDIQEKLKQIDNNISYNLTNPLVSELKSFIIQLCTNYEGASEEKPITIEPNAIYNYFQRKSRNNQKNIEDVRQAIRKYLLVDIKWN